MKKIFSLLGSAALLVSALTAQTAGPDVIVGDLIDVANYGQVGGINAYALGTTSCNIGTTPLQWVASTNQHPVIGQNLYRVKNGRFEQIGISWLKHGFTALAQSLCATCQNPGTGALLGVNCSDPYVASLNGSQTLSTGSGGVGPRNEVNPATGFFKYPVGNTYPTAATTVGRRLQAANADVDPALNAGAVYFGEGQYITPDDAASGNDNNNASHRRVTFTANTGGGFNIALTGTTVRQQPAIYGWQALDPTVQIATYDVPGDGRFIVAWKHTAIAGGGTHVEYAVHNLNSDRSGGSFKLNLPAGTTVSNTGFHDVPYHSGEPYDSTDWIASSTTDAVQWSVATPYSINSQNGNALRWGTSYSFWADLSAAPTGWEIGLYKPVCPTPFVPAAAGYIMNTSAPYDAVTLATASTGPTTDNASLSVPIGFTFNYYNRPFTTLRISSNGHVRFGTGTSSYPTNSCLPTGNVTTTARDVIAGFWDDLTPGAVGTVRYATIGTAPNRRFVVHWNNVTVVNTTQTENFQIILDETTNKITSTIIASGTGGAGATRGIQDQNGGNAYPVSCNVTGSAVAGTSVTWTPAVPQSAGLTAVANGAVGGSVTWDLNSLRGGAPVILVADISNSLTSLGNLGNLNIGFVAPVFIVDGPGAFSGIPDASAMTSSDCGTWSLSIPLAAGAPSGLTFYSQAVVMSSAAPNGMFDISTPVTVTF